MFNLFQNLINGFATKFNPFQNSFKMLACLKYAHVNNDRINRIVIKKNTRKSQEVWRATIYVRSCTQESVKDLCSYFAWAISPLICTLEVCTTRFICKDV